jgi:hypothetical protein
MADAVIEGNQARNAVQQKESDIAEEYAEEAAEEVAA